MEPICTASSQSPGQRRRKMPTDPRLKAQVDLILESHPDAAAFPANWEAVGDVDYLYRKGETLVMQALERLFQEEGEQASEHREEGEQASEHRMRADTRRIGGVVAIS